MSLSNVSFIIAGTEKYHDCCKSTHLVVIIWLMRMYCVCEAPRMPMPFDVLVIFRGTQ